MLISHQQSLIHYTFASIIFCTPCVLAHDALKQTEDMIVEGRKINLLGDAVAASEGFIGQHEINARPILRTGEILEFIPGMVVTQHSGTGKANQYFLRGFNLDHGTDFNTTLDGMPLNMRTHGHGQGYTDLNFIIPETIHTIHYKKGPYYSNIGDFSGAGSAQLYTSNELPSGVATVEFGDNNYARLLLIDSHSKEQSNILYGVEYNRYDGPWKDIDEDLDKANILLKYKHAINDSDLSFSVMAYDNSWNSADQIPARAVSQGIIDELGSIDPSVGGESSRYSINSQWRSNHFSVSAYAIQYDMKLWSNFTYFLDNESSGDQFEQVDKRRIYGGNAFFDTEYKSSSLSMLNRFGIDYRFDDISEVGLYHTQRRKRLGVIRSDNVTEQSAGLYWENKTQLSSRLRTIIGARHDQYSFDVDTLADNNYYGIELTPNNGKMDDSISSIKASAVFSLTDAWETYLSAGQGFHSNDARGTTITINPADGTPINKVDPLVRTLGYEAGLRGFIVDRLNTSLAWWTLDIDSELLFVGDAGNTEASHESSRRGIEITAYYYFNQQWTADFEYAKTNARFTDSTEEGDYIPGAAEHVLQAGLSGDLGNGWSTSARLRHFSERPLVQDNSIRSDASTIVNILVRYSRPNWALKLQVLNVFDSSDHDIDYFYESRLAAEPSGTGIEDIHYHIFEPRTLRLSASIKF